MSDPDSAELVFKNHQLSLVNLSQAAERLECSKQYITRQTKKGSFPAPVHRGSSESLWHMYHIVEWCIGENVKSESAAKIRELNAMYYHAYLAKSFQNLADMAEIKLNTNE